MSTGHKPTIGLLGAPGSGKSLVARQLASLGCAVIDADQLARLAMAQQGVRDQIAGWWGGDVLDVQDRLNRAQIAEIVFNDPVKLAQLEALIHPMVHDQRRALTSQAMDDSAVKAVVEDCPLLLETGIDKQCDVLIYVDCPLATRQDRVKEHRGWTAKDLARREKQQVPLDIKRQRADYVIDNDADEAHCLTQTRRVLSQIIP
jgi:dephospho-CoA kinase